MKFILLSLICLNIQAQETKNLEIQIIDQEKQSYNFKVKDHQLNEMISKQDKNGNLLPFRAVDLSPSKKKVSPDIIWSLDIQAGTVTVTSNFTQIPGDIGTRLNLGEDTLFNYRLYLNAFIKNKHQIRLLYAPLTYEATSTPSENILFNGITFLAGIPITTGYRFNSYRLSYLYHFDARGKMKYRVGFTAKIRDAYTEVTQLGSNLNSKFDNIGFVPLLHLGAIIALNDKSFFDLEAEGSWAPQGYALDARGSFNYNLNKNVTIGIGAGYLDGGADVQSVNTFARTFFGFGRLIVTIP